MQRIYLPILPGPEYIITDKRDGERYHQFTRVLRIQRGDQFKIFTDRDGDYTYEIVSIDKDRIISQLGAHTPLDLGDIPSITLYQALPNRLDKIEYILQKGCEVGISKFVFFPSHRSNAPVGLIRKMSRLRDILIESTEQSYGLKVPELLILESTPPVNSGALITSTQAQGATSLTNIKNTSSYDIWIGPEGGWSDGEMGVFIASGTQLVHFGPRILRTETAGVVATFYLVNKA